VIIARTETRWGEAPSVRVSRRSALGTFNDISLTTLLCYHLQRAKNGLRETDGMIQTMMGYGLRAGVLSCIGSIVLVLLIIILPTKPYYVGVHVITARVYVNSLLAMLNWRIQKKTELNSLQDTDLSKSEAMELSTVHWGISMASQVSRQFRASLS